MKTNLQDLYEKILIVEVAGALNYWLTPTGDLIKVSDHIGYIISHVLGLNNSLSDNEEYKMEDKYYQYAYSKGFVRVVEEPASIYFSYHRTRHPDKNQFMTLYGMAQDKNKNLVDGETQKIIVKNNEIEPDVARSDKLNKIEQDLKPSFYKNRNKYSENFSKFDLSDYTEIIY